MSIRHCVAVDLGASSGRVMLASYQPGPRALTLRAKFIASPIVCRK